MKAFKYLILVSCLSLFTTCKKNGETVFQVEVLNPSDINETDVVLNWNVSTPSYDSLVIRVSDSTDMYNAMYSSTIVDKSITYLWVDELSGLTNYYYCIDLWRNGNLEFSSEIHEFTTVYTKELVSFTTNDGLSLSGYLGYLSGNIDKGPGVLFMHEMGNWVNNWNDSEVMIELIKSGYVCMPFFFRGHGNSESIPDIGVLIEDWDLITNDLKAAIAFIKSNEKVHSDNIVLAGGSLGGIMAIAGNGFPEVTVSVALSAPDFGYNSIFKNISPKGVFYIAAENDINVAKNLNFSTSAYNMFGISAEPKKILIIPNSAAHGTVLFKTKGVNEEIISWIKEHS